MKSFSISGDLGDIIYALPVVRELGCDKIVITARARTRQNLLEDNKWQTLQRLLESQSYIDSVEADNSVKADVDGDLFRGMFFTAMRRDYNRAKMINLTTWHCIVHGVNPACQEREWLSVEPNQVAKYVFNRSFRYRNPEFPWQEVYDAFGKDAVFLGTEDEYQQFITDHGPVPYLKTDDLLDAAKVIKGSEWFFGNQSCLYSLAEGMKHNAVLEVWPVNPNCCFGRPNVRQGWNHNQTKLAIDEILKTKTS